MNENLDQKRSLSGIQPTGKIHLGNYLGAIKNWVLDAQSREVFCMIADLHAITVPYDTNSLVENTYDLIATLLASGLDSSNACIFVQSTIEEHAYLTWMLSSVVSVGELSRMTQYKDKGDEKTICSIGLLSYPVLQTADIVLYDTSYVPIGEDQKQHLEYSRDWVMKFNARYGDVLVVPEPILPKISARLMDLQLTDKKMSKSLNNPKGTIFLNDTSDEIRVKFRRAVTDSGTMVDPADISVGLNNLFSIQASMQDTDISNVQNLYVGKQYGFVKDAIADVVISKLEPIRQKYFEYSSNRDYIKKIVEASKEKCSEIAFETIKRVKNAMGFKL
jgi:tryptophanyl-tRNA synthetase